jgi:hypothetical protein
MNEPQPVHVCHLCHTVVYDTQRAVQAGGRLVHVACLNGRQPMIGPSTCR